MFLSIVSQFSNKVKKFVEIHNRSSDFIFIIFHANYYAFIKNILKIIHPLNKPNKIISQFNKTHMIVHKICVNK